MEDNNLNPPTPFSHPEKFTDDDRRIWEDVARFHEPQEESDIYHLKDPIAVILRVHCLIEADIKAGFLSMLTEALVLGKPERLPWERLMRLIAALGLDQDFHDAFVVFHKINDLRNDFAHDATKKLTQADKQLIVGLPLISSTLRHYGHHNAPLDERFRRGLVEARFWAYLVKEIWKHQHVVMQRRSQPPPGASTPTDS